MYVLNIEKGIRVLAIAPHSDDIELGCGATLLWLAKRRQAELYYRVLSTEHRRVTQPGYGSSRKEESMKAADLLGVKNVYTPKPGSPEHYDAQNFEDARFPENRARIHEYLEHTKMQVDPHLVLAPSTDDMHQDHVTVAETVARVFREGQTIWHYEIHQFYSQRFVPNLYVDVSEEVEWEDGERMSFAERKNHILQSCFVSQADTIYLDQEVILGNMRARGQQCARGPVRYAEAFQARMSIFDYQGFRQGSIHKR
jgi:LmbE family N-acetylglucosaminyl deacetylase